MGEQTKISWTDSTVNFWSGCTKVSEGCKNCYAETLSKRGMTNPKTGKTTIGKWGKDAPRQWHESAVILAHRLHRKPWVCDACGDAFANPLCPKVGHDTIRRRRVFSLSLGDWLDPEVSIEWLALLLDTIRQTPHMDWLLLTKRPENWEQRLEAVLRDGYVGFDFVWPWLKEKAAPANIWLGTSVENQEAADKRIPQLLQIPAKVRFLSVEPMLGPVKLPRSCFHAPRCYGECDYPSVCRGINGHGIAWCIVGGESGTKARPCNIQWIRDIRNQCKAAGVAYFVKQLGRIPAGVWGHPSKSPKWDSVLNRWTLADPKGGDMAEWAEDLRVREFPKL